MRFVPAITTGIKDGQVRQLFESLFRILIGLPQTDIYKFTKVWHVPFDMTVPTSGNAPRISAPAIVRLGRAVAVGDEITPVHTGSVLWTWAGSNQVTIQDAAGLVDGVTYELTFEVLGYGGQ
jgi:hypothetical protein